MHEKVEIHVWGHQKFLVALNNTRLHYKTLVQLKSNMKYYPKVRLQSTWRPIKDAFVRHKTRDEEKESVRVLFTSLSWWQQLWERQHGRKLCFIKVLINQSSPICFSFAAAPSHNNTICFTYHISSNHHSNVHFHHWKQWFRLFQSHSVKQWLS